MPPPLMIAVLLHWTCAVATCGLAALVAVGRTLVRSVDRGDAMTVPSLLVAAIMVLCVLNLFLTTRPRVKQWIAARRR